MSVLTTPEPAGESAAGASGEGRASSYLRNWLSVGVLSALGVAAGVGAQTAMAWRFGTRVQLDGFYVTLLLASFVPVVFQTAIGDPFIPAFLKAESRERFAATVFALTLGIGVLAGVVLLLFQRPFIALVSPGFSSAQAAMARSYLLVLAPVPLLYLAATYLTALLAAERRFAVARGAAMIVPAVQCLGIVAGARRWGMPALLWATVAGYLAYAGFLWLRAGYLNPFQARVRDLRSRAMRSMLVVGAPMTVTIAAGALHSFLDRAMSSRLGPGSISTLAYAEKLNNVICTVFLLPLTFVALPYLSAAVRRQDFVRVYVANVRAALLLFIPAAVFAGGLAVPLVDVALRRGDFGPNDVIRVAAAFAAYMIGVPLYAVANLTGRAFVASGRTWILAVLGPIALGLKFVLNTVLMARYGVTGAALATSIGYTIFSVITLVALLSAKELRAFTTEIPAMLVAGAAAGAALFAARLPISAYSPAFSLMRRGAIVTEAAVAFAAVYAVVVGGYYYVRRNGSA